MDTSCSDQCTVHEDNNNNSQALANETLQCEVMAIRGQSCRDQSRLYWQCASGGEQAWSGNDHLVPCLITDGLGQQTMESAQNLSREDLCNLQSALANEEFVALIADESGMITRQSLIDFAIIEDYARQNFPEIPNLFAITPEQRSAITTLWYGFDTLSGERPYIVPNDLLSSTNRPEHDAELDQTDAQPDPRRQALSALRTYYSYFHVETDRVETDRHTEEDRNGQNDHEYEYQPDYSQEDPDAGLPPLNWDARLSDLRINVQHPEGLKPGDKYWRLIDARYMDENQAGGRVNIFYHLKDENGVPVTGYNIAYGWPDGQDSKPIKEDGSGDFNMGGGSWNWNAPLGEPFGAYRSWVNGYPSDVVLGMGLPDNHHVAFDFTWQLVTVPEPGAQRQGGYQSDSGQDAPRRSGSTQFEEQEAYHHGEHWTTPDGRRADQHPDLNLDWRGWQQLDKNPQYGFNGAPIESDPTGYHWLGRGDRDGAAPRLSTIFSRAAHQGHYNEDGTPKLAFDHSIDQFELYAVGDWNWGSNSRAGWIETPPVTMAAFETNAGEPLYPAYTERELDELGGEVKILYADDNSITFSYTIDGTVAFGYTIHIEGINVNSAIREGQIIDVNTMLGSAKGNKILMSIRDTGQFMDIRDRSSWWLDSHLSADEV